LPAPEKFREVLDCGSPLPLFSRQDWQRKSGRGLPQFKTLARKPVNPIHLAGHGLLNRSKRADIWLKSPLR
jgi:hypothetical protein